MEYGRLLLGLEDAATIFGELELGTAELGRRHLLESARFRELLAEPPLLARAA